MLPRPILAKNSKVSSIVVIVIVIVVVALLTPQLCTSLISPLVPA